MEKQRNSIYTKFCRRLLVLLSLLFVWVALGNQLFAETKSFYTNTDIEFRFFLPEVKASELSVIEPKPEHLQNAQVRAIKKTGDVKENGSWIYIWYRFDKEGTYKLPDLQIKVKNKIQSLTLESIEIKENPMDKLPRIVIAFENGKYIYSDKSDYYKKTPVISAPAGKKLCFTLYIQYTNEFNSFEWDLPQNALFSKIKDYDSKKNKDQRGTELLPVADFEWKSLKTGLQLMPRIKMNLTSFYGERMDVIFPEFYVRFTEDKTLSNNEKESNLFSQAFIAQDAAEESTGSEGREGGHKRIGKPGLSDGLSKEDCLTLAKLYRAEAKSLVSKHKKTKERLDFEKEHGITSWLKRKIYLGDFGISLGCRLFSIPEEAASEVSYIKSGNALEIKESTGDWLFVRFGETEGWCKKNEVIVWTWETF